MFICWFQKSLHGLSFLMRMNSSSSVTFPFWLRSKVRKVYLTCSSVYCFLALSSLARSSQTMLISSPSRQPLPFLSYFLKSLRTASRIWSSVKGIYHRYDIILLCQTVTMSRIQIAILINDIQKFLTMLSVSLVAGKKVLAYKKDNIIMSKYNQNMTDVILNNMNHILNGSPHYYLKEYDPALEEDKNRWNFYKQIAERLKKQIGGSNSSERESISLREMKELKVIYEDVILQNSDHINEYERGRKYQHYAMNAHMIKDVAVKQSLDNLLSMGSELGQCRQILRNLEHNFKQYLDIKLDNTIFFNLSNIEAHLFKIKPLIEDNFLALGDLNTTSILLDQITSKIQHNKSFNGFTQMLQKNIRAQQIKTPFTKLYELLENNNINLASLKDQQNIVKEINQILDIKHDENNLGEKGLHEIKRRVSQIEDIEFEHYQNKTKDEGKTKVLDEIISELSAFACGSLTKPLLWLSEKQLRLLKDSFKHKIISSKSTPNGNNNHQQSRKIEELERQMTLLKNKHELLEANQSQLNDHLLNKQTEIEKIKAKYRAIFTVLKSKFTQLKSTKQQLRTQLFSLCHLFEDQKISTCQEINQKINEHVQGIRKYLNAEKQKEIQKVQERRRLEKNKLADQYQEAQNQLTELKEKYYTQITAKLCKSKLDMSMSKMDNVETNDCAVGSSFMLLENSIAYEESFRIQPNQEEEVNAIKTEEQLMAQINKLFQDQTDKLKKKIGEQEEVISNINKENERNHQQLKEERSKLLRISNELELIQKIVSQKQALIRGLQQNINKLKTANSDYESTFKRLNQTTNTSSPHSLTLTKANSAVPLFIPYSNVLFQAQIFSDNSHHKETLIKHIQAYMKIQIIKTNLLHKFDPNNKANFHLYIDNKKHLICVVKTKHAIIAGFYPGQLKEGVIMNEGGLLVSVTNDQSYSLMQKKNDSKINYRGMTYDPYYVIFGNAEMRVRSGEKRVFCNFGIQNSYFDYTNKPRNIEAFLNNQFREVEFQYCEFYQLIFQEPYPSSFDQLTPSP